MTVSETSSLRSWRVSYLLPYPATSSAVADKKAKGYYRHDQVMLGVSKREVMRELSQLAPMATSNSPTFGQSNSPMAGRWDYDVSSLVTMRAAASLRR